MKKIARRIFYTILVIAMSWGVLTLWVEGEGRAESWKYGDAKSTTKAVVVYDPDPFYDLDKKVCTSIGQCLAANGIYVTVATVSATREDTTDYDAFVLCANTYNWQPDWAVTSFVEERADLRGKKVAAITLGAGSTESAQKALEELIIEKECKILSSGSLWLMRPNDETRTKESNVAVAESIARSWGTALAKKIKSDTSE